MGIKDTIKLLMEDVEAYQQAETEQEKDFIKSFITAKLEYINKQL